MDRVKLSKNFYLDEFQVSQTAARNGIDMSVTEEQKEWLELLCDRILQPVRNHFGPVSISSGYRPPKLNKLIGGSKTSQHMLCQAADFNVPGHTPLEVARWISLNCEFDQVIHEFGRWVHASVAQYPRLQELTAMKVPGLIKPKTKYVPGLVDIALSL